MRPRPLSSLAGLGLALRRCSLAAARPRTTFQADARRARHARRRRRPPRRQPRPQPQRAPPLNTTSNCGRLTASLHPPGDMPSPGACPPEASWREIDGEGYLVAGVDAEGAAARLLQPRHHQIEGFEIDLVDDDGGARSSARQARRPARRLTVPLSGSLRPERGCGHRRRRDDDHVRPAAQVDFSTVYYDAKQKVLVPSNSLIRSDHAISPASRSARRRHDVDGQVMEAS